MNDLRQSKVWDERYDLPLFRLFNNPFIYSAYIWKLLGKPEDLKIKLNDYALKCMTGIGRFTRWPDGTGGKFSHDEIIGIAFIGVENIAESILVNLQMSDGIYNQDDTEADNMYKFIFLEPFLRQCAGLKVSYISQAKYIAHILFSAFTWKKDSGSSGVLKIWLMNDKMKTLPLCGLAILIYEKIISKKGVTLGWMISEHFPEYDELLELVVK